MVAFSDLLPACEGTGESGWETDLGGDGAGLHKLLTWSDLVISQCFVDLVQLGSDVTRYSISSNIHRFAWACNWLKSSQNAANAGAAARKHLEDELEADRLVSLTDSSVALPLAQVLKSRLAMAHDQLQADRCCWYYESAWCSTITH